MEKKCEILSKSPTKVRLDLSDKSPHDISHLIIVLKKLEKEGKIRVKVLS